MGMYVRALLAIVLAFFLLNKFQVWSGPWSPDDPLGPVSALELIEAAILVSLCNITGRPKTFAIEELCIVALTLCIVAALLGPKLAFGLASVFFAVRLWTTPGTRPVIFAVLILCAQLAGSAGFLFSLHRRFGAIDAAVVRWLTNLGGFATTGSGSLVMNPSDTFAIDVNAGCASSYVVLGVTAGLFLIILWRRKRLAWADLPWAVALMAAVTILNWARLVPMVASREAYLFWHDDMGAQVIALLDGAVTCGLAFLATRQRTPAVRITHAA